MRVLCRGDGGPHIGGLPEAAGIAEGIKAMRRRRVQKRVKSDGRLK